MIKDHFEVVSFEPVATPSSRGDYRERLLKVASALNQEGLSLPISSSKILDYLYAVDSVFKTEMQMGMRYNGVDITTNYTSVDGRVRNLLTLK